MLKLSIFIYALAGVMVLIAFYLVVQNENIRAKIRASDNCYYEIKRTGVISDECQILINNIKGRNNES